MLIPVKYHKRQYPAHIRPKIDEIAGHFDVHRISTARSFSIHTEYSYGKRKLNSNLLKAFSTLQNSHNEGVPRLWYSEQWAVEFANFLKSLCNGKKPAIIEIHPPFSDYAKTIEEFLRIYKIFEELILEYSPNSKILIENRFGTTYKGGEFLICRGKDLRNLCGSIYKNNLKLRIALDFPQLFSAYGGPQRLESQEIRNMLNRQKILQAMTDCIHLWGKKRNTSGRMSAHFGDLNTYFENDEKKDIFLEWLVDFLQDAKPRYFVPEVNSSDKDLHSIIRDLEGADIKFS